MWKHASPFTPSLNIRQHLCFWAAKKNVFLLYISKSPRVAVFVSSQHDRPKPSWRFPSLLPMHQMNVGYIFSDASDYSSKNAAPTVSGLLGGSRDKPLGFWFSPTYAASADCCHAGLDVESTYLHARTCLPMPPTGKEGVLLWNANENIFVLSLSHLAALHTRHGSGEWWWWWGGGGMLQASEWICQFSTSRGGVKASVGAWTAPVSKGIPICQDRDVTLLCARDSG